MADGRNKEPEHQRQHPYKDQQGHKQHHEGRNHFAEAHVVVCRLCRTAVQAHTVHLCNGVGHIVGAGHYGRVVIPVHEVILHGLGNGAGLTFQRGVAEAVAVGHIVIVILVDGRLHHQQDQHAVIIRSIADAPCVEGLCCIILSGIIARIIYSQYADLCPVAALFQLGIQVDDGLGGAVAQNVGIIHHTLISGQIRQAGGGKCRRAQGRKAHYKYQCKGADAFCNIFHAKGSTSFIPARPPSTLAGKPPVSFW